MFIRTWSVAFSCFVKAHPYVPLPHCFVSGVDFFKEAVVFFKREREIPVNCALQSRNSTKHKVQKGSTRINKDQKGSLRCVQIIHHHGMYMQAL